MIKGSLVNFVVRVIYLLVSSYSCVHGRSNHLTDLAGLRPCVHELGQSTILSYLAKVGWCSVCFSMEKYLIEPAFRCRYQQHLAVLKQKFKGNWLDESSSCGNFRLTTATYHRARVGIWVNWAGSILIWTGMLISTRVLIMVESERSEPSNPIGPAHFIMNGA